MEDCPPVLVPFVVDRQLVDGLLFSSGSVQTDTRRVDVEYVDNRFSLGPTLWIDGLATLKNRRDVQALVKYRNAVPLDPSFVVEIPIDSPACLEGDRIVGYWEASIPAGDSVSISISWSVLVFDLADLNRDGYVDAIDLGFFLVEWGDPDSIADFNFDGVVDGIDLGLFFERWTG